MKRERHFFWGIVTVLSVLFLVGFTGAGNCADKVISLKIQSAFPHGDLSMDTLADFGKAVEKRSNGKVKVAVFADGDIVPGDQGFVATSKGAIDMIQAVPLMWDGTMPVCDVEFGLPQAFKFPGKSYRESAPLVRSFFFDKGFIELLRAEYKKHGLYLLDIHTYGTVPFMVSKKPVKTCDDLKGMKFRTDGINMEYHNAVGMQCTNISGLDTYMALKLGTLDGAEWDLSCVTGLRWHEVAPYWIIGAEADHGIGHILFNLKKWDALPADAKKAIQEAAEDYWNAVINNYEKELNTIDSIVQKGELKKCVLDDACKAKYTQEAQKIWDEVAKRDEPSAKAVKMLRDWRATLK
jgi:TRAP-type C4-dicarboxylate transport system substrate-binding protein